MNRKWFVFIVALVFVILVVVVASLGFFDKNVFLGMLVYGMLYIGGYFYIVNAFDNRQRALEDENANKTKFEWCYKRINQKLRNMPNGQGMEWDRGSGRVSEFRTFHDGTQNKPFRSIAGYLVGTQQYVVIIFDIDGDDIVRFMTNPPSDVISDHFYKFDPFRRSTGGMNPFGYNPYSRSRYGYRRPTRGIGIHMGGDAYNPPIPQSGGQAGVESFTSVPKPDPDAVDKAAKRIG